MAQSRRQFLKLSAGVGVGLIGGGGVASADDDPPVPIDTIDPITITRRANALERATRGRQVQVNPPPPPPPPERWSPGDFVTNVVVEDRRLAFTFVDGPSPDNTHHILRALRERNVTATFFVVGVNVRAWPQLARDIVGEGHELGNHSVFHTPCRPGALARQIVENQEIIEAATGVRPVAHRAPGRVRGATLLEACRNAGLYEVHTHMVTSDRATPRWSASRLISQFATNVRNGALPIYADGGPSRPTRRAIGAIVDIALARGYELHTATGLINAGRAVPGRSRYDLLTKASATSGEDATCCAYDARAGLLARLDNPTVKQAERSRIVEQLAMFDDHLRAEGEQPAGP